MQGIDWRKVRRRTLRGAIILAAVFFISSFGYALYLRWFPPLTTPLMVVRSLESRPEGKDVTPFRIHAKWASYDHISTQAMMAVIASEDQRFAEHSGFDYEAIEKAYEHNQRSKKVRGASTISQQVAKNVFLWPSRSWLRKGFEVYFTVLIETLWPKERILEMYLNAAEMGDGIFGIEAATEYYYKKPAQNLTAGEASLIAAVLPNPRKFKVLYPGSYVRYRQSRILRNMRRLGGREYLK